MVRNDILPVEGLTTRSVFSQTTDGKQAGALAAALRKRVRGEVRFDAGSRAIYATDLSIYRQPPIGVVPHFYCFLK